MVMLNVCWRVILLLRDGVARKSRNRLWALTEQVTPTMRVADFNQAMMDIGAMVCTRTKPKMRSLSVKYRLFGHKNANWEKFPAKNLKNDA